MTKVDYNRPLIKKIDQSTGIEVYMYMDLPGVYYNTFESQVSEALAASAGYDVALFGKQKRRREQLVVAMDAIDAQLDLQEDNGQKEVVVDRGGFSVVHIGLGRHIIEDQDGGKIVDRPLTLDEAKAALEKLVPKAEEKTKKPVVVKSMAAT